jgi:hypothetical protein
MSEHKACPFCGAEWDGRPETDEETDARLDLEDYLDRIFYEDL